MRGLVFILLFLFSEPGFTGPLSARLTTSVARDLDPNPGANRASVTLEPSLRLELGPASTATLGAVAERPFDPSLAYTLPRIALEYRRSIPWADRIDGALRASVTALNVDRWRADGVIVRPSVRFELSAPIAYGFAGELLVGPYLQLTEESQATDGTDLTRFGFTESVALNFRRGAVRLQAKALFDQRHARTWYNDVTFSETAAVRLADWIELGVTHDRLTSAVDPTTGRYRGFVNTAGTHRLGIFAGLTP